MRGEAGARAHRAFVDPWPRGVEVAFRPLRDDDLPFLRDLYCGTREAELAPVPWPAEAKRAFLEQQFALQHQFYRDTFPQAAFLVIEHVGAAIGRVYLDRADEFNLIDITLQPAWRGRGLGGALLDELLAEAAASARATVLHVEPGNPARRLYLRKGFEPVEVQGFYEFMRHPGAATQLNTIS